VPFTVFEAITSCQIKAGTCRRRRIGGCLTTDAITQSCGRETDNPARHFILAFALALLVYAVRIALSNTGEIAMAHGK